MQSDFRFQFVTHEFLLSSACQSYLPWISHFQLKNQQKENNFSRIIAVDEGCELKKTEMDLKRLLGLTSLISRRCLDYGLPFICSYFYRPLVNGTLCNEHWPTRDQCTAVKTVYCQSEWKILESLQQSSDFCIPLPDCRHLQGQDQSEPERKVIKLNF